MNGLTDIPGISVGHWTNLEAGTGCTVILCPEGAVAGVDVRGGAPGTRELALLDPLCAVERVHAIMLAGGSAFGLAAADGAMRWLEEHDIGYDVGIAKVPIVPSAILFDLPCGRADVRPDAAAGYAACVAANDEPVAEGNIGAGTGATVGKLLGFKQATKGGIGSAARQLENGVIVAALVVVNAVGDVIDPTNGQIIAGVRDPVTGKFANSVDLYESRLSQSLVDLAHSSNTTLAVVATNVALSKTGCSKVAQMAHDGLARAIRPVHTMVDGDLVFALSIGDKSIGDKSLGDKPGNASIIGVIAAEVLSEAIVRAVRAAEGLHGIPAAKELVTL